MKGLLAGLARYHAWAFERLYEALAELPDDARKSPCGLFFGSIDGTLAHLVDVDLLWYGRVAMLAQLQGVPAAEAGTPPNAIAQAARWLPLVESLDDARLAGELDFTATDGQAHRFPLAAAIAHVFNHATHHRGQISAAVTAAGFDAPELDLFRMLADGAWGSRPAAGPGGTASRDTASRDTASRDTASRDTAIRDACVEAALDAWEYAGISGLCAEGRWEVAIGAIRSLDPREIGRRR